VRCVAVYVLLWIELIAPASAKLSRPTQQVLA